VAGEFDKDFGYLLPFLDKIAQAADSLSNSAAGKELRELVSGEKTRWIRIRELLNSPTKATVPAGAASSTRPATATSAPAPAPSDGRPAPPQFTVGRLKGLGRS
jgi:hypothetical protein